MEKTKQQAPFRLPKRFSTPLQWKTLQPFYEQLLARELTTVQDVQAWFEDRSALEDHVQEYAGWLYIHRSRTMTCQDTRQAYEAYNNQIVPHLQQYTQQLNQKIQQCPVTDTLRQEAHWALLLRGIDNTVCSYHADNIPLFIQNLQYAQQYKQLQSAMTIDLEDKDIRELTIQQATPHLESPYRGLRQRVYEKISTCRLQKKETIDTLYTALVKNRHQIATNAGFANFVDYSFVARNRFDYTPQDCIAFHQAVQTEIIPVLDAMAQERKALLGLPKLYPWDYTVDLSHNPPLRPFRSEEELVQKTTRVLDQIDPYFGDCLRTMQKAGHLDLMARKGKAPGGYNYPLDKTKIPYIFMQATACVEDIVVMLHECGHAVHAFLTQDLPMPYFRHCPAEIAELAAMAMELLTLPHWNIFFEHEEQTLRAQNYLLRKSIYRLAWIAAIDCFQHWVYTHPEHTVAERKQAWCHTMTQFSDHTLCWQGVEDQRDFLWQTQLHLFEHPLYYIEYAIAQLGAIAIWMNYLADPQKSLQQYSQALQVGYTQSIPNVYAAAGISFDFSGPYIRKLVQFVRNYTPGVA